MAASTPKMKVISASRRIDMVGSDPDKFAQILREKLPPEKVHTLVIWTKNPRNLLTHQELSTTIRQYDQIHLHLTVTGMGGSYLEPAVPKTERVLAMLPALIDLVRTPRLIRFRFDPIVRLKLPDGRDYCNLGHFKNLAPRLSKLNIRDVSISWMSGYRKVLNRLKRAKIMAVETKAARRREEAELILSVANKQNLRIHWCSMDDFPRSRCIDGELYNELHPKGYNCSVKRAKGQRRACGCTESLDIGWYYPCEHGCLYCYANPKIRI